MDLVNNLINIKNTDYIYNVTWERIKEHLSNTIPERIKDLLEASEMGEQIFKILATDTYFIHYSLYPLLKDKNENKILEKIRANQAKYMNSDRFQGIKPFTTLDENMSLVYAISFLKTFLENFENELMKYAGRLKKKAEQGDKKAQQLLNQPLGNAVEQILNNLANSGNLGKLIQSAEEKAKEVTKNAKDVEELLGGKKAGKEPGTFSKILNLAIEVTEVKMSKEIITMSKALADSLPLSVKIAKQRGRWGSEISGYVTTRNIEKALPRELAMPDEIFLKKLSSNGFLTREKLEVKEGAYYVLIDKSGSMTGIKTVWSRSVALALFKLAQRKKRKYFLRFFDTKVYPEDEPIQKPDEIVDYLLTTISNGGTNIDNAIRTAIKDLVDNKLSEYTNTIILITDGEDEVLDWRETFKMHNISLVTVMIQGDNGRLRYISDQYLKAELTEEEGKHVLKVVEFT